MAHFEWYRLLGIWNRWWSGKLWWNTSLRWLVQWLLMTIKCYDIYTRSGDWVRCTWGLNWGQETFISFSHIVAICRPYIYREIAVRVRCNTFQSGLILGFAPSQWETALLCNDVSHWLGANPRISPGFLNKCIYCYHDNARMMPKRGYSRVSFTNDVSPV